MIAVGETVVIGMGEMSVARGDPTILACLGLGSCIALCMYDPISKLGGMAHIVLPQQDNKDAAPSPKYADAAVPLLLREMRKSGAPTSRLIVKVVGGAQVATAPGINGVFKIGERNAEAVREAIAEAGVALAATDIGGHRGRTVRMYLDSGRIVVTTVDRESNDL